MSWLRIDDGFSEHPKVEALADAAFRLHVSGLCYCSRNLTDGFVSVRAAPRLMGYSKKNLLALVAADLWHGRGDKYEIHDYLVYNPTRESVLAERARGARRQALFRDPVLKDAIRGRDGDVCRYCGKRVAWTDRRSPLGGTYDHIDPDGPNDLDNLVVCCRGCNASKSSRTPTEAGMKLRSVTSSDPGTTYLRGLSS